MNSPIEYAAKHIESAEALLMTDYSPQATLAKTHLHMARIAVEQARNQEGKR